MEQSTFLDRSNAHKAYDLRSAGHIKISDGYNHIDKLVKLINEQNQVIKTSSFGFLFHDNSLLKLFKQDKVYLIHTTTQLSEIEKSGHLYSSSGCLVGSMYCTPAFERNGLFELHNLGSYIGMREAPFATSKANLDVNSVQHLLIEVDVPKNISARTIGVDYLQLGAIHYNIFKELEYLLSGKERYELESIVKEKIRSGVEILHHATESIKQENFENHIHFFDLFVQSIDKLPILGYIYFEAISEYLQLFSTDKQSYNCASKKEVNNWHYKSLLFGLYPNLLEKFNLGKFSPSIATITRHLETLKEQGLANIDYDHMFQFIQRRIIIYICNNLLMPDCFENHFNRNNIQRDFSSLIRFAKPLIGHLIHRELRNFGRYPDFYFYFEQEKALKIRNYRNNMNIIFPFNGITPKGEIGINPAFPDLIYSIYNTKETSHSNNNLVLSKGKKLDITIVPRIIDLKNSFMRM